jgi:hypothetical protein
MTDHPALEKLPHQDFGLILDKLQLLLANLPNQIPSKPVDGPSFIQPDDVELVATRCQIPKD